MIIRTLLIAITLLMVLWFLHHRSTSRGEAWSKVGVILIFGFAIFAIVSPQTTNKLANVVGVGRGADLLLYGTTILLLGSLLLQYLHRQDDHSKTIKLARKLAIADADGNQHNAQIIRDLERT